MNAEAGPGSESSVGADDAWLDEALAQSFPASDPISRFHDEAAVSRRERHEDLGPGKGKRVEEVLT